MNCQKVLVALIIFCFSAAAVQTTEQVRVSSVFAVLTKSLDSKTASVGQELTFTTISDVVVHREVIIPRGSSIVAHVTQVATKGKENAQSALAVVVDKSITADKHELPVQAIIAAIAAPRDSSLSADPTYGMMRSNEPKMVGARPSGAANSGELSPSSKATSTAAVATAELKGVADQPIVLDETSQGATGYDGLSISWSLASPPPVTIFTSRNKNLKLLAGSQVLMRMVPPRAAK
jgi:hypothetical protein